VKGKAPCATVTRKMKHPGYTEAKIWKVPLMEKLKTLLRDIINYIHP
jgi:hypothetical protein